MEGLRQPDLFEASPHWPHGLVYRPDFITRAEEKALLEGIAPLPFREARFQEYFARRRVVHFRVAERNDAYGSTDEGNFTGGPLPPFLAVLERKIADSVNIAPGGFVHALISEYRPGTPIRWRRDKPVYGVVVGLSLAGHGRMRFRPLDGRAPRNAMAVLDLEPRSLYVMQGPRHWQHSMLPTKSLRYSITFRTRNDQDDAVCP